MEQEIFYDSITEMVNDLSRENLIDLLEGYNEYVLTFYESHDSESQPVGLLEYFHNDYFAEQLVDKPYKLWYNEIVADSIRR